MSVHTDVTWQFGSHVVVVKRCLRWLNIPAKIFNMYREDRFFEMPWHSAVYFSSPYTSHELELAVTTQDSATTPHRHTAIVRPLWKRTTLGRQKWPFTPQPIVGGNFTADTQTAKYILKLLNNKEGQKKICEAGVMDVKDVGLWITDSLHQHFKEDVLAKQLKQKFGM